MSATSTHIVKLPTHGGRLEVHLLGLVDFDAMLGLQEQQIYELSGREDNAASLFLCEHPPIISMGREASRAEILADEQDLQRQGIPVRWVSRGGGAFVHAPGQLSIYLQVPLNRLGLGLADYRSLLERSVLAVCREMHVPARRDARDPGIWSRGGQLGYFGGAVKSWVTCQGLFLNVNPDLGLLRLRGGREGVRPTSIQSQRLDPVRMPWLRERLIHHIAEHFGYETADVSTGHPLLKRTSQRVAIHA